MEKVQSIQSMERHSLERYNYNVFIFLYWTLLLVSFTLTLKVHFERLIIAFCVYLFQIHFVHYNPNYANISVALGHDDGLMVMGFFLKVTHFSVNGYANHICS